MEEKIKSVITQPLKEKDLVIDTINFDNKTLNIILDSNNIIDLDKIVEASKLISDILDKEDFIKNEYLLDVSSKEKGDVK